MNIAMEQTEEYVNGQLKNKYGDCFIRGNNGGCSRSLWGAAALGGVVWLPAAKPMLGGLGRCNAPACAHFS
jgi:hypothetical protein